MQLMGRKGRKKVTLGESFPSGQKHPESWYQKRLAKKLGGDIEVQTPVGRIDILTKTEIIEVKTAKNWKAAIGQVKSYGRYYTNHSLRIHLFGAIKPSQLILIKQTCKDEGIALTHEEISL